MQKMWTNIDFDNGLRVNKFMSSNFHLQDEHFGSELICNISISNLYQKQVPGI